MKMYKSSDIAVLLLNGWKSGAAGYCGFSFNERENLVITLKEHEPSYLEGVQELEILTDEGEY